MRTLYWLVVFVLFLTLYSFKESIHFTVVSNYMEADDSIVIENTQIGSGSKIMTDQDALVILPPPGKKLASIALYYSSITTNVSDSSRLWVKSQRSWSCAPLGNAHPLQNDSYTLGLTNNVEVQLGWNHYTFDQPISIPSDSIFIWPDLIQQVQPRVVYGSGNMPEIGNLTNSSCATFGSDVSILDYVCRLTFVSAEPCPPFLFITDSDSSCYAADTILARTMILNGADITYLSKDEVVLDTTYEVQDSALLTINMSGCH